MVKFTIRGTLPGLNELIEAERTHRQKGAALKKQCETVVMHSARALGKWRAETPVYMIYHWYEPNRRRDKDNISSFGRKVIQDALVKSRHLQNDGWNNIIGFEDRFEVDKKNPRIVVEIIEVVQTMLDEKTLAILGDRAAQERLTERGELLPCPNCGSDAVLNTWRREKERQNPSNVKCAICGLQTRTYIRKKRAIRAWNTRALILTPEQIKRLEGTE